MKSLRKIMALVIAMVMTLAMVPTAFAAPTTYTITIQKDTTDKAAHTYGAYQIFTGKLETKDNKDVLSDIKWGAGVTGSTLITELNKIKDANNNEVFSIPTNATAADVAKAISDKSHTDDSTEAQAIADAINAALTSTIAGTGTIAANASTGTISGLAAGYYLVKDTADVTGEGSATRYILEVVKDVTVAEKANVPSVIKKVKEKDDGKAESATDPKNPTDWQDAADYDIGDSIPYKLEGTLPGKFAEYDTYKVYTFTDTLSAGLTAPAAKDIKVTLNTEDGTDLVAANIFEASVSGQVITVKLKPDVDLRTADYNGAEAGGLFAATDKIIVTYNAVLNENAKIGSEGNPNTVKLDFTNNPNGEQDGKYGTTPEDRVIVFTYEIKALKVEPDGTAIDQEAYAALTHAQKADYVKVGDKWQKTKALSGAGFTLYKKVAAETEGAVDGYLQIGKEITGVTTFEFKGTDAGEYKLVETTVPTGYNKADDVVITVNATYDTDAADPKLKTLTVTPETAGFTVTTAPVSDTDTAHITTDGIINGKVLNQSGSVLPSTGGIGTTIFYIVGAILVVGAGILLVTRRRMNAN